MNELLEYFSGDELAANVWKNKYACEGEKTPKDMHIRMAKEFARVDKFYQKREEKLFNELGIDVVKNMLSSYGRNRKNLSEEEIFKYFDKFKTIIPQGSVMSQLKPDSLSSLSNCFVIDSAKDSYGGICKTDEEQIQLMKRRGGVGHDISTLRPAGAIVHNSANTSTGAVSFMNRFSESTREVSQKGRRGALMLSMDVRHPDIKDFITSKKDLTKNTGANISVKLNNLFMKAVEKNEDYYLTFPCNTTITNLNQKDIQYDVLYPLENGGFFKKVKAQDVWNLIVEMAHDVAEPGILFWDTVTNFSPDGNYYLHKPICTNPCFRGDMRLLTADGYKTFEQLAIEGVDEIHKLINAKGDIVDGEVWRSGVKGIIRIDIWHHDSIYCTPNHRFMTTDMGLLEAKDLGGHEITSYNSKEVYIVKEVTDVIDSTYVYDFSLSDFDHLGVVEGVIVHNCGEIPMPAYDACRLMALNFTAFVNHKYKTTAYINEDYLYKAAYEAQRLSDDLVDLELEHISKIIDKIVNDRETKDTKNTELELWNKIYDKAESARRTGVGFTGLWDAIAMLCVDKEQIPFVVDKFLKIKKEAELDATIDMAILRGTFPSWDKNECDVPHKRKSHNSSSSTYDYNSYYFEDLEKYFPFQSVRMKKYGRRNISQSTVAPTGTTSMMSQTSSGIEPVFSPFYKRRKKVAENSNERVDFIDANGDKWTEFQVLHENFKNWIKKFFIPKEGAYTDAEISALSEEELTKIFKRSPWYGFLAEDIDYKLRIDVQAIAQHYTSHSISSTINLPKSTSYEDVSNIYMYAWKKGCKGVTVYVEGSRDGVLIKNTEDGSFPSTNSPKRPKVLDAECTFCKAKGIWIAVVVGLYKGKPYEVFAKEAIRQDIIPNLETIPGTLTKDNHSYFFKSNDENLLIIELEKANCPENGILTRLSSLPLRHGGDVSYLVDQLNKEKFNITDFPKTIARVLKKYIPDGTVSTSLCPVCGGNNVVYEEGCKVCKDCGDSQCGG